MTYIVLRDTFGDGLEVPDLTPEPEVLSRSDLDQYVASLVEEKVAEGDGVDLACDSIVICEILDTIDGEKVKDYARKVYKNLLSESVKERRALYLKLKSEFDPDA